MATDYSLLVWAKSIAPHVEEGAVWPCRAGAGGHSRSEGSGKGARPKTGLAASFFIFFKYFFILVTIVTKTPQHW